MFLLKWPRFALLDAALLFPVAVLLAGDTALIPMASRILGHRPNGSALATLPLLAAIPYVGLLRGMDRVLGKPNGILAFSAGATLAWAAAAALLAGYLPAPPSGGLWAGGLWAEMNGIAVRALAAALAGGVSLLLHAGPLRDAWRARGAFHYLDPREVRSWRRGRGGDVTELSDRTWNRSASDPRNPLPETTHRPGDGMVLQVIGGTVLIGGLCIGFLYRDILLGVSHQVLGQRTMVETPHGTQALATPTERQARVARAADGRFVFDAVVNGQSMPMRFDDGVPAVTLRAEDALRLGISMARLDFSDHVKTAKGTAPAAGITIDSLTVGAITYRAVPGLVARPGALEQSILAHSFVGRLAAWRIENDWLIMEDRSPAAPPPGAAGEAATLNGNRIPGTARRNP